MHEQVHEWHNFTPWQALPTIAAADVQEICCLHSFQGPTGNILLWSSGLQRRRHAYNAVSDKTCVDWQMTRLLSLRLAIKKAKRDTAGTQSTSACLSSSSMPLPHLETVSKPLPVRAVSAIPPVSLGKGCPAVSPAGAHEGRAPVRRAHHARTFRPLSMLPPAKSPVELVVVDGISPTQDACRDGLSGSTPIITAALIYRGQGMRWLGSHPISKEHDSPTCRISQIFHTRPHSDMDG